MATTLSLLIPGLLNPGPSDHAEVGFPKPAAPALEWLLARAETRAAPLSADVALFEAFGLPVSDDADPPVAAVTRLADGGEPGEEGWWLRADPVHLRPDLRGVFLVDARILAIEPTETQALAAAFNQTFAVDGLRLDALRSDRWYLRLPTDPGLRTHPLHAAIGRDINPLLPQGSAGRRWNALLTEIQMLFHHHPVNRAREERNQPLVNSVWFWGGGCCPSGARAPAADLYANDPLTRGLARLAGTAIGPVPESAGDWLDAARDEADSLVVLETTRFDSADDDPVAWAEHVAALERAWFAPCRRLLRAGTLTRLQIQPGNGRTYAVNTAARWRFWQYPRSLYTYLLA